MRRWCVFLGALATALALSVPPQSVALQGLPRPRYADHVPEDRAGGGSREPVVDRSGRGSAPGRVLRPPPPPPIPQDTTGSGQDSVEADTTTEQSIAVTVRVVNLDPASYRFALEQNYPNPSRDRTVIHYSVARPTRFTITIYSIQGQRVTTLVDRDHDAGNHSVTWDLVDDSGKAVPPGVYIYRAQGGNFSATKKIIVR